VRGIGLHPEYQDVCQCGNVIKHFSWRQSRFCFCHRAERGPTPPTRRARPSKAELSSGTVVLHRRRRQRNVYGRCVSLQRWNAYYAPTAPTQSDSAIIFGNEWHAGDDGTFKLSLLPGEYCSGPRGQAQGREARGDARRRQPVSRGHRPNQQRRRSLFDS